MDLFRACSNGFVAMIGCRNPWKPLSLGLARVLDKATVHTDDSPFQESKVSRRGQSISREGVVFQLSRLGVAQG